MSSVNQLYQRFLKMKTARQSLENSWKDCYAFALPQKEGSFCEFSTNASEKLFDGTAPDCVDQLAACIFSELTPSWRKWFNLVATNVEQNEDAQSAEFLEDISQTLNSHLNLSNFSVEMHQCFLDLVTVGTACLLFEEARIGEKTAFHFTAIPLSEIYVDEGYKGVLDTTFRYCQLPLSTVIQRFECEDAVNKQQLKDINPADILIPVIECVVPKKCGGYEYVAFVEKDADGLFGKKEHFILKQGCFETSPFITFRWIKASGEVYGRSPVMKALPDIKTTNKVVELILKNATIAVTGIWQAEDDGVLNPANIRLVPGTIIPKAVGSKGLTPLQAAGDFDVSQLILEDLRNRIRHALLNDKLGQVQNTKMTATEVLERSAEMIRILGAVYSRLQTELLTPLIERGLSILRRRGEVPILFLDGYSIKITYQSPVADLQNQRQANEVMNFIHSFADMNMDAFQIVDVYGLAKWLANQLNIPMDLIKNPEIKKLN
ncbi:MAG: phage tail protein [Alphaproteobacteria bacterium]|nr:phage tail protein [Alphaproteobacteria bacterium]